MKTQAPAQADIALPSFHTDPAALEQQLRRPFDRIAPFTVGAEEELMLVGDAGLGLVPAAELALGLCEGDRRVTRELRKAQLEAITPVCCTAADVQRELASVRRLVGGRLEGTASLLAAGTHPLALAPGPISDSPRYQEVAAAHPWAARHAITCGLHVHVAAGGADRTLAVHNALRSYLPEILALAANAPYYHGEDSGLATVRPKLCQFFPRAAVPPAFASWRELAKFAAWARDGGAFPDGSYHWWDLRLNFKHGTLEIRVADVQTRVEDAAAIVALVQSLVYELAARHDAGESLPVGRDERIVENTWLATRDGLAGVLIDLDTGRRTWTADRLLELSEGLHETAVSLGCEQELARIGAMIASGGGAGRQRRAFEQGGPGGLVRFLCDETARSAVSGAMPAAGSEGAAQGGAAIGQLAVTGGR